jgi:predicted house-cleaning noncanonical NTP pyrophosphatase (MazG superfamily)
MKGKLVRDKIPEIIQQSGLTPVIETASPENYRQYVKAKLQEELNEYLSSENVDELADIIEVCFAAATLQGLSQNKLLDVVENKRKQRGGFTQRIIWLGNTVTA